MMTYRLFIWPTLKNVSPLIWNRNLRFDFHNNLILTSKLRTFLIHRDYCWGSQQIIRKQLITCLYKLITTIFSNHLSLSTLPYKRSKPAAMITEMKFELTNLPILSYRPGCCTVWGLKVYVAEGTSISSSSTRVGGSKILLLWNFKHNILII